MEWNAYQLLCYYFKQISLMSNTGLNLFHTDWFDISKTFLVDIKQIGLFNFKVGDIWGYFEQIGLISKMKLKLFQTDWCDVKIALCFSPLM